MISEHWLIENDRSGRINAIPEETVPKSQSDDEGFPSAASSVAGDRQAASEYSASNYSRQGSQSSGIDTAEEDLKPQPLRGPDTGLESVRSAESYHSAPVPIMVSDVATDGATGALLATRMGQPRTHSNIYKKLNKT